MYKDYISDINKALAETELHHNGEAISDYESIMKILVDLFTTVKRNNKQVFFVGNGGSAAIASHMTADFMKNGGINTCSLYDSAVTSCLSNDYGYEHIFEKQLDYLGHEGNLLVAISSSGNSTNIVRAIESAQKKGMIVLTFTGFKPDNIAKCTGDYNLYVPVMEYGKVETIHNLVLQQIVDEILYRDGVAQ